MQQLEIQYFFPLTEQIPLDLDFTPCEEYVKEQQRLQLANSMQGSVTGMMLAVGVNGSTGFTIDVDQMPITIVSKEKPGFFKAYIYKILGMKWKAK